MQILFSIVQFCYSLLPRKMQKALKNTMNKKETKPQYKIEFLNGDPHKITNYEILSHNIVLINAKNLTISIIRALFPLENLILALILIILFAVPLDEYDDSSRFIILFTLASLSFEMMIQLISLIANYYQRSQYIKKINEKECCVLSQLKDLSGTKQAVSVYQTIKWRNLNLGEIVCLQYDDISPADLLILDSSLELIQIGYQYRSACNSTFIPINSASKGVMIDFKINLSGKLSFTEEVDGLKGSLKLKNDPKSTTFSRRNLILRGERLDSANWLFGIVIRVGEQCQCRNTEINQNTFIKSNGVYQQLRTKVFIVAFSFLIVCLIAKLISDSFNYSSYFYDDLAFILVMFPQNLLWLNQLYCFMQIIRENSLFKWKLKNKIANQMDHIFQRKSFSNIRILQEDENKILVPIPNHNNYCNLYNSPHNIGKMNPKPIKLKGYQQLNQMNIIDLVNTQIVVFENSRENCSAKSTISTIRNHQNTYQFNYSKIQDLMSKSTTTTKHNFEKILIETNRFQMYDEQKTTDFDLLIAEKNLIPLKQSQQLTDKDDEQPIKQFQKPGFFREKTKLKQEGNNNPYLSFRKSSFRNQKNINLLHSPQQSSSKQQFQFNRTAYFNKSFQKMEKSASTDHLVGDQLTEMDFFEHLFTSEENTAHEMLIVSLLCNTISSYYNSNTQQLQLQFSNFSDKTFIEFAELFDYLFLCSTVVDNFKQEYQLPQIIKKIISIQGEVKIFEILFLQGPTEQRKDTLSILVRDPESFLLDEGCLLYTRIKTNKLKDNEKYKELNESLEEMIWDGESPYLYFKQELSAARTEELLKQIDQISQTYGDRQQELDKVFSKLEEESSYLFTFGLKREQRQFKQSSQIDLSQQIIESEKIYLNLLTYGMKICFLTQDRYEDLILFLRNHYIIQSKDQIIHFYEKEVTQLQNKVRLQLEFLIEEQLVLEPEPKSHLAKFIIINEEALLTILQDEYLKHHVSFIMQFSLGLAGYQLNHQMRVKFFKQLRTTFSYITTLGNSSQDKIIFNKSNSSFCIYNNDPLIVLNNPDFMITKINQLLYMLFILAPQEMLKFFKLLEFQLYRTIILGVSTYVSSYFTYYPQTFYLLLIYLIPSNILMTIFTLLSQHNYQKCITLHQFSLFARRFESVRAYSPTKHILKIFLLSCLESISIVTVVLNLKQLTIDGKESPESIVLIIYINCEILEKLKIYFQIIDDETLTQIEKIKQIMLLLTILIISILIFQIAVADTLTQVYNLDIFLAGLFTSILAISISLEIESIFDQFNFSFTSLNIVYQIEKLEIQLNKFNQLLNYQHLSYLTTNTVSILNKLFEKKEIIDDCILKYLKGDNFSTTEQMDKFLNFIDKRTESDFRNYIKYNPQGKAGFIITFIGYEALLVLGNSYVVATVLGNQTNMLTNLILSIIQFIIQLLILFTIYSIIKNKSHQLKIKIASNFIRFAFKILFVIGENGIQNFLSSLLFMVSYSLNFQSAVGIRIFFISLIIPLVIDMAAFINGLDYDAMINGFIAIKGSLVLIIALFAILQLVYKTEYIIRYQYILKNKLSNEYKKLNDVLGLLVPKFIKERITKGQIQISEEQGEVTILFCDICDFDNIIRTESVNIVEFLDNLYRSFDQICQTYDIQKIETVGKTYMAAAGLKDYDLGLNSNSPRSTVKILQAAIKMMESAKTQKFGQNQELILKIGIHYGKVIAGVIGAHKPQFSLIGDTVNTTSRVCSTGMNGFITLSEQAYNNIGKHLNYTFIHKQVTAKGKGLINTYQLIQQVRELKPQQSILMSRRTLIVHQNSPRMSKRERTVIPSKFGQSNNEEIQQNILLKKRSSQLSETLKSPKLVIRQRQKDLQITPQVVKRSEKQDLFRSGNAIDFNRQSSQNFIADNRARNATFQKPIEVNLIKTDLLKEELNRQFQDIKVVDDEQPFKIEKIGETQIKESQEIEEIKHQKRKSINYCKDQIKQTLHKDSNQNIMKLELKTSQDNIFQANQAYVRHQVAERRRSTVRKTLIIVEQPKVLKQISKQFDRIPDDGPQTQYDVKKIRRLKSTKQNHEGTLSAAFRSPKEQKLEDQDEIEVPKVPFIIQKQSQLNADYVECLLKFKVDQYSTLQNQSSSIYHNDDQSKYNQIYELYKDCEISQTKRTSKFLTLILIIIDLLYFNYDKQTDEFLNSIIAIVSHCLVLIVIVIIIHKLSQDQLYVKYIKGLLLLYLLYNIAFLYMINVFIQFPDYEIILTLSLMATIYINIFNLDIFTLQDRKYLAIIYLVGSQLLSVFRIYQFQISFFSLSIFLITFYAQFSEKKILASNYQLSLQLEQQQAKQKSILSYLLPAHILARFLQVESNTNDTFTDVFEDATILFADIAGFTKYSSSVEAEQVVNMLRILFQQFDEFCQKMDVYKLFTIGDCYVCMGIVDANNRNPVEEAINVILFGLKMIEIINQINKDPQFQHLNMRIGAHTGKIIGGVVGTDVVRYDIYGEDVTIANKMESNGSEGQMMVSEATKDLIESEEEELFQFVYAKDVYINSQDEISAFFVQIAQQISFD